MKIKFVLKLNFFRFRYLTVYGLRHDLATLLMGLELPKLEKSLSMEKEKDNGKEKGKEKGKETLTFPLATHDVAPVIRYPNLLYGRDEQLDRATQVRRQSRIFFLRNFED